MSRKNISNPVKLAWLKPTKKNVINATCAHCMGCTSVDQGYRVTDHLEPGFRVLKAKISGDIALILPIHRCFGNSLGWVGKREQVIQLLGKLKEGPQAAL